MAGYARSEADPNSARWGSAWAWVGGALAGCRCPTGERRAVSDLPASLAFVDDEMPGIRRRRAGRGFTYLDAAGDGPVGPRRCGNASGISPSRRPGPTCGSAPIRPATSRRPAGTRGAGSSTATTTTSEPTADERKFDRLRAFGRALVPIRRRVAADLGLRTLERDKVVALVVHLLESTLIRVGNEEYSRTNGSYGLTTLRSPQVRVRGADIRFAFPGKSGVRHTVAVHDARTARAVRRLQDLPGQRLLRYVGDDGELHGVGSADVNAYLHEAAGEDYTAKDFRTWMGTLMGAAGLAAAEPPASDREGRTTVKTVMTIVGKRLGNTATVARDVVRAPRRRRRLPGRHAA